jgi:hypothetical protein
MIASSCSVTNAPASTTLSDQPSRREEEMFSKRNAFIGWLVLTLGKPIAKRKARQAVGGKKGGAIAAAVAAVGAAVGGIMFWRKRRGQDESPGS